MIYLGFDLGDGESCVTWSHNALEHSIAPAPISGHPSFLSAVGRLDGELVVGYDARGGDVEDLHVCFKRHFLEHDPEADQIMRLFARGVLKELRKHPTLGEILDDPREACFIVGCPAGWKREERNRYRDLLKSAGMKNVKVVSESRAAYENAIHDPANALTPDWKEQSVLVIDIGSSTLDFAYVYRGNEYDISTMGNVLLGGGLMDEMIVRYAVDHLRETRPEDADRIEQAILASDSQKSRLMLLAREIKEEYFNQESDYLESGETLSRTARLYINGEKLRINLILSPEIVENWLISRPHPLLKGQSFVNRLRDSLIYAHHQAREKEEPALVILTGGPSRMRFFRELCRREFPQARVICSDQPEMDISRGLVYLGSIDEKMEAWIADLREYIAGEDVERIIDSAVPELVADISDPLAELVVRNCVTPTFMEWKNGSLKTLKDFETRATERISEYLVSSRMQEALGDRVTAWSRRIMQKVGDDIRVISQKHKLDMKFAEDGFIRISSQEGGGIQMPMTFLNVLGTIVSTVLVTVTGMICGGAGLALIAEGVLGIVVGILIAAAAIVLGGAAARELILRMDIPLLLRKLIRTDTIDSPANLAKISRSIHDGMLNDEELRQDLVRQVSEKIDQTIEEATASLEDMIAS